MYTLFVILNSEAQLKQCQQSPIYQSISLSQYLFYPSYQRLTLVAHLAAHWASYFKAAHLAAHYSMQYSPIQLISVHFKFSSVHITSAQPVKFVSTMHISPNFMFKYPSISLCLNFKSQTIPLIILLITYSCYH